MQLLMYKCMTECKGELKHMWAITNWPLSLNWLRGIPVLTESAYLPENHSKRPPEGRDKDGAKVVTAQ